MYTSLNIFLSGGEETSVAVLAQWEGVAKEDRNQKAADIKHSISSMSPNI